MDDGTVIVDPAGLQRAIDSFNLVSNNIGNCISSLQKNISEVSSAWIADASDTYQAKLRQLSENITKAQDELQQQTKILAQKNENYISVIKKNEANVESLSSGFMK